MRWPASSLRAPDAPQVPPPPRWRKVTRAVDAEVTLVVDPEAHGERQDVVVETRDGRRSTADRGAAGHWAQRSRTTLREKFLRLAGAALGATRAAKVADLWADRQPGALTRLFALSAPSDPCTRTSRRGDDGERRPHL